MQFQPGANIHTTGFGNRPENVEVPHYDVRAPNTSDTNYPVGKVWVWAGNGIWDLLSLSSAGGVLSANWVQRSTSSGNVLSVTGTADEIDAVTTDGNVVLSIPDTFIAPGSIVSTSYMTANGALTGAVGISSGGNIGITASGDGLIFSPVSISPGASPLTYPGRVGSVTFTGVSIAAGATQSFVIDNTAVPASTTQILWGMFGATAGAALSIVSITNVANTSSTIVVTNGTGATTSTANITFVFLMLN